jgi:hypothetical protein
MAWLRMSCFYLNDLRANQPCNPALDRGRQEKDMRNESLPWDEAALKRLETITEIPVIAYWLSRPAVRRVLMAEGYRVA